MLWPTYVPSDFWPRPRSKGPTAASAIPGLRKAKDPAPGSALLACPDARAGPATESSQAHFKVLGNERPDLLQIEVTSEYQGGIGRSAVLAVSQVAGPLLGCVPSVTDRFLRPVPRSASLPWLRRAFDSVRLRRQPYCQKATDHSRASGASPNRCESSHSGLKKY